MPGFIPLDFNHQTGLCLSLAAHREKVRVQPALSNWSGCSLAAKLQYFNDLQCILFCSLSLAWRNITSSLSEENWLERIICSGPTYYCQAHEITNGFQRMLDLHSLHTNHSPSLALDEAVSCTDELYISHRLCQRTPVTQATSLYSLAGKHLQR